MNIFVLDQDPQLAAQMQCDRHVVKMTLETAQLLCTTVNLWGEPAPYRPTHKNHPCALWARQTYGNFQWLCDHGLALAEEYTHRYGKVHKSESVIRSCAEHLRLAPLGSMTQHVLCMPDEYKVPGHTVESYRKFYQGEKARFAQWNKTRKAPMWWF